MQFALMLTMAPFKAVCSVSLMLAAFLVSCSDGSLSKEEQTANPFKPVPELEVAKIVWYDARHNNTAVYLDFNVWHHGITNKGAIEPSGYFGAAIENCSNETLHCLWGGLPYSLPKDPEVLSWTIDLYSCEFSGTEVRGKVACKNTGELEESSIQSFVFEIKDGCIQEIVSLVVGRDDRHFVYDARDDGICLSFIRQFS